MIGKLNNNRVPEETLDSRRSVSRVIQNVELIASSQSNRQTDTDNTQDTSLQISFDGVIEQARRVPAPDGSALARAKELITSGRFDTSQNVWEAAQNMLIYGV